MPLFDFFRKPQPQTYCCCEGDGCCQDDDCCDDGDCCADDNCCSEDDCCCDDCRKPEARAERFVKVLGGGCKNCHKLVEHTQEALKSLGMDEPVELITDMAVIAGYGVMSTPALVVDGKVVSTGRVLSPEQAAQAIRSARGK